jgi:hypothetical protein
LIPHLCRQEFWLLSCWKVAVKEGQSLTEVGRRWGENAMKSELMSGPSHVPTGGVIPD